MSTHFAINVRLPVAVCFVRLVIQELIVSFAQLDIKIQDVQYAHMDIMITQGFAIYVLISIHNAYNALP
jgi:hypothetical protein